MKNLASICLNPIGTIYTPHKELADMPIQPLAAEGIKGHIELLPEFAPGLKDMEGFSHIILIYHLHKVEGFELEVTPFMDHEPHGIFSTRAPKRPNPLGFSTVKLLGIDTNIIHIEQVDMLNETPLIDIKPFFERFDNRFDTKSGWLEKNITKDKKELKSDNRFL